MKLRTTRREFAKTLGVLWPALGKFSSEIAGGHDKAVGVADDASATRALGFPLGSYTPFGYLDNPYHSWALNRSGVVRSVPPIGFGICYPAGPGGYFNYEKNSIYRALLRIGFRIGEHVFYEESDFREARVKLTATHHSKNMLAFAFSTPPLKVAATFFLVGENTLACVVEFENVGTSDQQVEILAVQKLELGAAGWWGRDGIAGFYQPAEDQMILRSFAAGPVFALKSGVRSSEQTLDEDGTGAVTEIQTSEPASQAGRAARLTRLPPESATAYYPKGLSATMRCHLRVPAGSKAQCPFYLSRAVNERHVTEEVRAARARAASALEEKRAEDDRFWSRAPQLEGDFPAHWKNSWVYDFETLRMMVRRPLGVYKHPWDAMQIQAPRNVLAETSIDMWAYSYADEATAKAVLLGQFQDALAPNVPCMREDGTMNMVAADGSECGTALQWCYPFYCLESVFLRTLDREWLAALYPYLTALFDWTLKQRRDERGWIVPKCSWETGMDSSARFLIPQPTGGERIDFIHIAELQAATAHAARAMKTFAEFLGKMQDTTRWGELASTYAEKTQTHWRDDWFYDIDTHSGHFIVRPEHREVTQVGPILCGVATREQIRAMIPRMREYETNQAFWLEWPSHVLPYVESLWRAGDREFLSRVLYGIIDRVYASMDRREVEAQKKLGWPGVSCELWGLEGASGGEGYGWGATLPAHIIRSVFGVREEAEARKWELTLGPNLPAALLASGEVFGLRNIHYRGKSFDLRYEHRGEGRIEVELSFREPPRAQALRVTDESGAIVPSKFAAGRLRFEARNHALYRLDAEAI